MPQNMNDLAAQVAELTKKQIADARVETAAEVKTAVEKAVTEALGSSEKTAELRALIAKDVLQRVPASAVFTPDKGKSFDPKAGLETMNAADAKALRDRVLFSLTPRSVQASMFPGADAKAMSVQVGADGGYLVPEEFVAEVQRKLVHISAFRTLARVWSGVGLKGALPRETGTVSVGYVAEGVAPTATKPAFGQLTWGLSKRFAIAQLTRTLFNFEAVDVLGLLATMFAEQFQLADDNYYLTGTGAGQPMGLRVQQTGMNSAAIAGSSLNWTDLVKLKHLVKSQYRLESQACAFMMHNDVISKVAQLRDDQNRPIMIDRGPAGLGGPNVPPQTVAFLLGYPVVENPYTPTTLGAGAASEIYFGNFKRGYAIFDGGTIETKTSDEAYDAFTTDTIYTRAIAYDDGKPAIPEALGILTGVL